jgi:signal transduction histidine kinase
MAGQRAFATAVAPNRPQLTDTERRLQAQFDKLEAQFRQLKEQTRQAQQLASLGTAAAMLAHEFNNLMTPMVSYATYALDAGDSALMVKALKLAVKQTSIVSAMADRILGLAANEAQAIRRANLAEIVVDAQNCLCRDLAKDGITLTVAVPAELHVLADPRQLTQVFFNLLLNARQAIKHRQGRIKVTAAARDEETVEIQVTDNGCGIPADQQERIFEAFFSTKRDDRPGKSGSGLGLALCREIVEEHRGTITVASAEGQGATFTITLPAAG